MSAAQAGRLACLSVSRFELCVRAGSRPTASAGPRPQQVHDLSRPAASAQGCRGKQAVLEQ